MSGKGGVVAPHHAPQVHVHNELLRLISLSLLLLPPLLPNLSLGLIRRFAVQILTAMRFLRKRHIVHCDLKPENILLKQPNKSGIKVCVCALCLVLCAITATPCPIMGVVRGASQLEKLTVVGTDDHCPSPTGH